MEKIDWDFKESNTKEYTHGFHTYPAMMIPQIARKLIDLYGKEARVLLDPFCGSGTSLVEASITDHIKEAHGFDLNPLAILISKAKTTNLEINLLNKELEKILDFGTSTGFVPDFNNLNFWFKPKVIERLGMLKGQIDKIKNEEVKNFFLVVLSETIRKVSNTRNSEFKLYRMDEERLLKHNPDVFVEFEKIAYKNISRLNEYNSAKKEIKINCSLEDSKIKLPLEDESVDIIVTSPPYGDSITTVAYGQFSRLALQWLGYEEANKIDKKLLGGIKSNGLEININSETLKNIIDMIANKDEKRAKEVLSFYEDFDKCIDELNRVMKKKGHVCFVVGNRTVKGINIPTDKIMIEMFKAKGDYEHVTTNLREIPFKRMPKVNSPTNIKGETVPTMNNEFIFILRKN